MSGRPLKPSAPALPVFDLGLAPYLPVQDLQRRLRSAVADGRTPGVLLLLEHEPVITFGSRAGMHDLRAPADQGDACASASPALQVVVSERGGQATLHAPGQLVSYPVVPIPGRDLGDYVRRLEEAIIVLLAALGIHGSRREGRPGVYVSGDKISSIGLRCQRWVSSHGTSLNVNVDLSLFDAIVSCGEPQLRQTSIAQVIAHPPTMERVKQLYIQSVQQVFGWELLPIRPVLVDRVEPELGLEVPTAGFEPATPGSGGQCSIP
jgi:lipoyl(octanoyl) transferase